MEAGAAALKNCGRLSHLFRRVAVVATGEGRTLPPLDFFMTGSETVESCRAAETEWHTERRRDET